MQVQISRLERIGQEKRRRSKTWDREFVRAEVSGGSDGIKFNADSSIRRGKRTFRVAIFSHIDSIIFTHKCLYISEKCSIYKDTRTRTNSNLFEFRMQKKIELNFRCLRTKKDDIDTQVLIRKWETFDNLQTNTNEFESIWFRIQKKVELNFRCFYTRNRKEKKKKKCPTSDLEKFVTRWNFRQRTYFAPSLVTSARGEKGETSARVYGIITGESHCYHANR